jgi:hypothetical protein
MLPSPEPFRFYMHVSCEADCFSSQCGKSLMSLYRSLQAHGSVPGRRLQNILVLITLTGNGRWPVWITECIISENGHLNAAYIIQDVNWLQHRPALILLDILRSETNSRPKLSWALQEYVTFSFRVWQTFFSNYVAVGPNASSMRDCLWVRVSTGEFPCSFHELFAYIFRIFQQTRIFLLLCGSAVRWGTKLQAGRLRVQIPWGHWVFKLN